MIKSELPKCPRCGGEPDLEYFKSFPATTGEPRRKAACVKCYCQSVFQVQRKSVRLERVSRETMIDRARAAWCAIVEAMETPAPQRFDPLQPTNSEPEYKRRAKEYPR